MTKKATKKPAPKSSGTNPPSKRKPGRPQGEDKQKMPIYDSMKACAAATGIPLALIQECKNSGSEAFIHTRVHLGPLLRDLFKPKQQDLALEAGKPKTSQDELTYWRALREKQKFEADSGLMVLKSEVRAGAASIMGTIFGELDRVFTSEMPSLIVGLREIEIRDKHRAALEELKVKVKAKLEDMAQEPAPVADAEAEAGEES